MIGVVPKIIRERAIEESLSLGPESGSRRSVNIAERRVLDTQCNESAVQTLFDVRVCDVLLQCNRGSASRVIHVADDVEPGDRELFVLDLLQKHDVQF